MKNSVSESNHSPLPARGAGGEAVITPSDIAPYVPKAVAELHRATATAKQEAIKNHRQVPHFYETIGDLDLTHLELANEYMLIRRKKSNLTASRREAVLTIGNLALQLLIQDTVGHVENRDNLRRNAKHAAIAIVVFIAALAAIWSIIVRL